MIIKHLYKVYCSYCKKEIGVFEKIPTFISMGEGLQNNTKKYPFILIKDREYPFILTKDRDSDAVTFYCIDAFHNKKCEKEFIKKRGY